MNLALHEFIHIVVSFLIGFFIYKKYNEPLLAFLGAFLGGVLLDSDHIIDYFLAFGLNFNLKSLLRGYQFLVSNRIYLPFHAWEWIIVLVFLVNLFPKKRVKYSIFCLALALVLFSHLIFDVYANHVTFSGYSILYRIKNNFVTDKLITSEHYIEHIRNIKNINVK